MSGHDLSDLEHTFLLYVLGNICADAVQGDVDAFEALGDPFWVEVITSLDNGKMDYEVFVARILRLRDDYRKRRANRASSLREMRSAATFLGSEGSLTKRLYHRRGKMPGLLSERAS